MTVVCCTVLCICILWCPHVVSDCLLIARLTAVTGVGCFCSCFTRVTVHVIGLLSYRVNGNPVLFLQFLVIDCLVVSSSTVGCLKKSISTVTYTVSKTLLTLHICSWPCMLGTVPSIGHQIVCHERSVWLLITCWIASSMCCPRDAFICVKSVVVAFVPLPCCNTYWQFAVASEAEACPGAA